MCGIAGIISHRPLPEGRSAVQAMLDALAHRGPDAEGLFAEPHIAFGQRRLSILDLSERGNQPMLDHTGRYALIHNGEIYNFRELRKELDYPWQTETDTEMILAAFAKWGPDCLRRFNGMFALVIHDRQENRTLIARDRLGIKPLYYHQAEGRLSFASETRALLKAPGLKAKVDRYGLANYLCYQTVYGTGSMLEDVHMLPPGHYMQVDGNGMRQEKFWDMRSTADVPAPASRDAAIKELRAVLGKAVERRLIADVPLGAFLSGGIDSSAVVALMSQVSERPVETFSVVFEEKEYDESAWSGMIAKRYNTRHHPILLQPSDFLAALPEALKAMDHPSGDGINSYVVSQVTRAQGIKVALSGLGGDELFAGYPVFTQLPEIQGRGIWKLPRVARMAGRSAYGLLKRGRQAEKIKQLLALPSPDMCHIYKVFRTIYNWEDALRMTGGSGPHPLQDLLIAALRQPHLLSQISAAEITSYTESVLLRDTDQMSMRHALEVRVPFFDHEVVELALRIPDEWKRPAYPKQFLVEAMGDLLPDEVVHRKKMGFVFPWEKWLRGELLDFCDVRIQRLQDRDLIDADVLGQAWQEFQAGQGQWLWTHIWLPVVLEEWMTNNGVEA